MSKTQSLIGHRLRDCARDNLLAAAQSLALQGDALHGGVHQARKALRRSRAILALGQRKFPLHSAALDADIRSLARGLSALRDAHALVETLERLQGSEPQVRTILPVALTAATARRNEILARSLQRDPAMGARRLRIERMVTRLLRLPWDTVGEKTVAKAMARSERRVTRAHDHAKERPHDHEAWHRLRRRIRRLRQQHSVLEDHAPQLLGSRPTHDARAEALGESQDDALLLARCGSRSPFAPTERAVLRKVARERLAQVRG